MTNIDELLRPLSPDPTGPDLRLIAGDETFQKIRQKREEVSEIDSPSGKAKYADWQGVVAECRKALLERSKDLDLARHLTEALVRLEGWNGLAGGLKLTRELLVRYWDDLHPGAEEGDVELPIRARPISWLGSSPEFLLKVKQIPLIVANGEVPRSWLDYEESARVDEAARRTDTSGFEELRANGLITGEEWRRMVTAVPAERRQTLLGELRACRDELENLRQACEDHFGDYEPDLHKLDAFLEDCLGYFERQFGDTAREEESGRAAGSQSSGAGATGTSAGPIRTLAPSGPIANRDDAYRRLREIAAYLREIEPHSPVPMLIERAVSWGDMPFDRLFKDVVKNTDVQRQVWETLGLPGEESA